MARNWKREARILEEARDLQAERADLLDSALIACRTDLERTVRQRDEAQRELDEQHVVWQHHGDALEGELDRLRSVIEKIALGNGRLLIYPDGEPDPPPILQPLTDAARELLAAGWTASSSPEGVLWQHPDKTGRDRHLKRTALEIQRRAAPMDTCGACGHLRGMHKAYGSCTYTVASLRCGCAAFHPA